MRTEESSIWQEYLKRTPGSRRCHEQALQYIPGGSTRGTLFHLPYPTYVKRGQGSRIYDVDGNEYVDFLNNYTSLALGHAHPAVIAAIQEHLPDGTAYSVPTGMEVKLAGMLCERVPSLERVLFTNSGTEAVMGALRAARAYTGRSMIAKFEGGYHGAYDHVCVSGKTPLDQVGDPTTPNRVLDNGGIPARVTEEVAVMRFNDQTSVETVIGRHSEDLAALIVEPVLGAGGVVAPAPGFLQFLRDITRERGILLIFDEVITLRMSSGGAQAYYGVTPDLTTMGKIIGGGLPVGAFGGRADVMSVHDPRSGRPVVTHLGTFNANPLTLSAGIATLEQLTPESYAYLRELGQQCQDKLTAVFRQKGVAGQAVAVTSLFNLHLVDIPIVDYRSAKASDARAMQLLHLGLMNEGIAVATRGMGCTSTAMTARDIDSFALALSRVLDQLLAEGWVTRVAH